MKMNLDLFNFKFSDVRVWKYTGRVNNQLILGFLGCELSSKVPFYTFQEDEEEEEEDEEEGLEHFLELRTVCLKSFTPEINLTYRPINYMANQRETTVNIVPSLKMQLLTFDIPYSPALHLSMSLNKIHSVS